MSDALPVPERARSKWAMPAAVLVVVAALGVAAALAPSWLPGTPAPTPAGEHIALGTSVEGRPIEALRFGTGPRRLLVLGGVHGDEFGAPVAEQFVEALRSDPSLVPAGATIDVVTCLNPDGRTANTKGNAHRTDLNRNMPTANWTARLPAKDLSATKGLNGGSAAGSEPETQALLKALGTRYDVAVSLHSAGGLVDYDGPGAEALASSVASASGMPLGHVAYQAYIHGSMGAYFTKIGTPIVTVELSAPTLTDGLRTGILGLALAP